MVIYKTLKEVKDATSPKHIDDLVYTATFSEDKKIKQAARDTIMGLAKKTGAHPASINDLYMAFGKKKIKGFTVPAFNVRTLTYDKARLIFQLAKQLKTNSFIFEIARSEMGYTDQEPAEYSTSIMAAAVAEKYKGPVFIQGDHFQFKAKVFADSPEVEIKKIKELIKKSVDAGFYNIDIDASTLVDLEKTDVNEQQRNNYEMTALLTKYIRSIEPKKVTVSIGGEIGHIGGVNSNTKDFKAFMDGYLARIGKLTGISKVSVQTGTSHGGIPLPDGTIAKVSLDFGVLKDITKVARDQYKIGGSVQHGASTLPNSLFNHFPKNNTLEIHLATGFQNIVYDNIPENLRSEMYEWIKNNLKEEWKEGWSEDQFIYKCRKKALGPFKKKLWMMGPLQKSLVLKALKKQFEFLMKKLNIAGNRKVVDKYVK
ncbi:MAG: class II fructose-bisphosphate aldolase [Patescibacteria group bacterium]